MAWRKRERSFAAAWLGLLALAVQAFLPALLAVEIRISPADGAADLPGRPGRRVTGTDAGRGASTSGSARAAPKPATKPPGKR